MRKNVKYMTSHLRALKALADLDKCGQEIRIALGLRVAQYNHLVELYRKSVGPITIKRTPRKDIGKSRKKRKDAPVALHYAPKRIRGINHPIALHKAA